MNDGAYCFEIADYDIKDCKVYDPVNEICSECTNSSEFYIFEKFCYKKYIPNCKVYTNDSTTIECQECY